MSLRRLKYADSALLLKCKRLRSLSLFSIKCNMAEPDEPSNDFVEFVIVKRSSSSSSPEAILLYESTNRSKYIDLCLSNFIQIFDSFYEY